MDTLPGGFTAREECFGTLPDGSVTSLVTLRYQPANGEAAYSASITNYGARLLGFTGPDCQGHEANVLHGPASLADCLADNSYAGAIIGRHANRIANASFMLDGVVHPLAANDGCHIHHGGPKGFDRACWQVVAVEQQPQGAHVELAHHSPHGDQGFPGNLEVRARYSLLTGGRLVLEMVARTDRPTVVSLTCHPYFNLLGSPHNHAGACLGHELHIPATHFLPISSQGVPEGAPCNVAGTPFDFRESHGIGERIGMAAPQLLLARGYDHHYGVDAAWPRPAEPVLHAVLNEPTSGRQLKIHSTLPGLQLYTGNFLGDGRSLLPYRSALCLEPQFPPNAPNRQDFPSTRLAPGDTWRHTIVYELGVAP